MMPKKGHLELEERVERGGVERNGVTNLEDLGEIRLVKVSGKMEGLRDFYRISDADVLDMWSKKVPFAYSIYELEYRERLLRLAECLFGIDNFISFWKTGLNHTHELLLLFFIILPIFFTTFVVIFIKIVIFIFTIILQ